MHVTKSASLPGVTLRDTKAICLSLSGLTPPLLSFNSDLLTPSVQEVIWFVLEHSHAY